MTELAGPKSYRIASPGPQNRIETAFASNSLSFHPNKFFFEELERSRWDLFIPLLQTLFGSVLVESGSDMCHLTAA